ncbi:MAG: uncharacterized protein KVP18_002012 [Porospora cf. gigantea A]|uniref:uncharacterized protein n=1 Tax=Porospora cf. gigantea A TaxID=2853593 RepID=UPI003559DE6B|nr:MAG: hypothetical protein KVP18_002012 [Porospora cf. gigantea A]
MITVSPSKLFNLLQFPPQHPVVVDLRSPTDFQKCHLRHAVCLRNLHTPDATVRSSVVVLSTDPSPSDLDSIARLYPASQRPIGRLSVPPEQFMALYPFLHVSSDMDHENTKANQAAMKYPVEAIGGALWVGDLIDGSNMNLLARLRITAVLDCSPKGIPNVEHDLALLSGTPVVCMHLPPSNYPAAAKASEWVLDPDTMCKAVDFVLAATESGKRCVVVDFDGSSLAPAVAAGVKRVMSKKTVPWCVAWARSRSGKFEMSSAQITNLVAFGELIKT